VTKAPWTAGEDAHGFSVTVTQGFGCSVGRKKKRAKQQQQQQGKLKHLDDGCRRE